MNLNRCIHLIEKRRLFKHLGKNNYESGYWDVKEEIARQLKDGSIFFHKKQAEPSYYGGIILGYRIAQLGDSVEYAGRIIFQFHYEKDHRDIKTARSGWSNEKKIAIDV